jgi:hypothetical protein
MKSFTSFLKTHFRCIFIRTDLKLSHIRWSIWQQDSGCQWLSILLRILSPDHEHFPAKAPFVTNSTTFQNLWSPKIGLAFDGTSCNGINGAEMINLSRYHQYSQEDKNCEREDTGFTLFMLFFWRCQHHFWGKKKLMSYFSLACHCVLACICFDIHLVDKHSSLFRKWPET